MARTFCRILGIATLLMGVAGFVDSHLLGFHLTPVHNIIHLATGVVASYCGFAASYGACRTFCRAFAGIYGLVALLGFVAPGVLGRILGHPGLSTAELMPDNLLHVVITLGSLVAGLSRGTERELRTT
jgi:hypothetical protein